MPPTMYIPEGRKYYRIAYWYRGRRYIKSTKFTEAEKDQALKLKELFEEKLKLLEAKEINNDTLEKNSKIKLKGAIDNYIKFSKTNWSTGRLNNVKTVLKQFTNVIKENCLINNLSSTDISEFIEQRKKVVSTTTLRSDLTILKAFFNYLIEENLIERSPINKRLIPKPEHKTITTFDSGSIKKIIEDVKTRDKQLYHYLCLLSYTGARPGDIINLTYGDIYLNNNNEDGLKIKISKTSREILFPMYNALKDFILDEFPDFRERDKTELIFKGCKVYNFGKKFFRLKKRLGLNAYFNLKTFRKTFATNLIDNDIDGTIVAHLLAHTSFNTTSKYYINRKTNIIKSQLKNIKTLNEK
jgi:integrase/recombinase XerD